LLTYKVFERIELVADCKTKRIFGWKVYLFFFYFNQQNGISIHGHELELVSIIGISISCSR